MSGGGLPWQSCWYIPARPCRQDIARLEYGLVESVVLTSLCCCNRRVELGSCQKCKYMVVNPRSSASFSATSASLDLSLVGASDLHALSFLTSETDSI